MTKEFDLVVIGDLAWNHDITQTGERLSFGGAAYYSAVGASCFSDNVGVVARCGDDFNLDKLRQKRIDTSGIKVLPGEETCRFEVTQHQDGSRDFVEYPGVSSIVDTSIFPKKYQDAEYIHLSTQQPEHALIWLDFLSTRNASVDSFELYVEKFPDLTREMFRRTNLIFTNESEWEIMKKFGDDFSEKEMIIKRGEKGAIYKYKNQVLTVPAPRVEAVDFSGAGDVLAGSFLVLRAKKVPIEKALKKAVDTASYSITDFGVEHLRIDSIEECL